jgi:hypothetical protein
MANLTLATKHTVVNALGTVVAATNAITHTADAVSALAEAGAAHATAYRDDTIAVLQLDATRRRERRVREMAFEDAQALLDMDRRLHENQELQALYDQSLAAYNSNVAKIAAQ